MTLEKRLEKRGYSDDEAIRAILGEAEGESREGKQAIGEVIRRRGSLKGVYGGNAIIQDGDRFYRKGKKGNRPISDKAVKETRDSWESSKSSDYSRGSTHWQSDEDLNKTGWDKDKRFTNNGRIGAHTFLLENRLKTRAKGA